MQVEIRLKAAKGGNGTPTYSTRDKIEGEVFVSCQQDRRFDEVELTFSGMLYARVLRLPHPPGTLYRALTLVPAQGSCSDGRWRLMVVERPG